MKTTKNKTTEKKVLKFHTGRGGRFYNSGNVEFVDFETIDESNNFDEFFLQTDENDNPILEDGEEIYFTSCGNRLDFKNYGDGTGYINIDNEYNSYNFVFENELSDKQIHALVKCKENEKHWNIKEIERILSTYYEDYI
jgi:hypothetical protein